MTAQSLSRSTGPQRDVPLGALVDVGVEARWTDDLPPVPRGQAVTVSLSSAAVADGAETALRRLGFRVVGVCADAPHPQHDGDDDTAGHAHFLVPQVTIDAHPAWWRTLLARAERTYGLSFGPVVHAMAGVLALHTQDSVPRQGDADEVDSHDGK